MYSYTCELFSIPVQLMISQAYYFVLFLKWYFSQFIPECHMTLHVIICASSLNFSLPLFFCWNQKHCLQLQPTSMCCVLVHLSFYLKISRQFVFPKPVDTTPKYPAACGALTASLCPRSLVTAPFHHTSLVSSNTCGPSLNSAIQICMETLNSLCTWAVTDQRQEIFHF